MKKIVEIISDPNHLYSELDYIHEHEIRVLNSITPNDFNIISETVIDGMIKDPTTNEMMPFIDKYFDYVVSFYMSWMDYNGIYKNGDKYRVHDGWAWISLTMEELTKDIKERLTAWESNMEFTLNTREFCTMFLDCLNHYNEDNLELEEDKKGDDNMSNSIKESIKTMMGKKSELERAMESKRVGMPTSIILIREHASIESKLSIAFSELAYTLTLKTINDLFKSINSKYTGFKVNIGEDFEEILTDIVQNELGVRETEEQGKCSMCDEEDCPIRLVGKGEHISNFEKEFIELILDDMEFPTDSAFSKDSEGEEGVPDFNKNIDDLFGLKNELEVSIPSLYKNDAKIDSMLILYTDLLEQIGEEIFGLIMYKSEEAFIEIDEELNRVHPNIEFAFSDDLYDEYIKLIGSETSLEFSNVLDTNDFSESDASTDECSECSLPFCGNRTTPFKVGNSVDAEDVREISREGSKEKSDNVKIVLDRISGMGGMVVSICSDDEDIVDEDEEEHEIVIKIDVSSTFDTDDTKGREQVLRIPLELLVSSSVYDIDAGDVNTDNLSKYLDEFLKVSSDNISEELFHIFTNKFREVNSKYGILNK